MNQLQKAKTEKIIEENPGLLDKALQVVELHQKETGLSTFLTENADGFWKLAADTIRMSDRERYLTRLAMAIANDEKLAPCFETPKGKMSIIQAMQKCIELGLLPGEEAYLIPYGQDRQKDNNGKWNATWHSAELHPKAEGYMKILLSEPNPIFRQIKYDVVYEDDHIIIDSSRGVIDHKITPAKGGRGEIIGAWAQFIPVDDDKTPIAKYWDIETVEKVRDTHSPSWKQYLENERLYEDCESNKIKEAKKLSNGNYKIPGTGYGNYNKYVKSPENADNPWATDKPQMVIKTILKSELRKWALIKPGLKQVIENLENRTERKIFEEPSKEKKPGIFGKADGAFDEFDRAFESSLDNHEPVDDQKQEIEQEQEQDGFLNKVAENELAG